MILVTLGTQDKSFKRLLKEIDKLIEKGIIKEEVIVQAGYTEYYSNNMKIFDLISREEMDRLIDKANLIITHGGVGSIIGAISKKKKVIAVARLSKYDEHTNDHQLQIVKEFSDMNYIIDGTDLDNLEDNYKKVFDFKPATYKSDNSRMISTITDYIDNNTKDKMFGKYREIVMYIIFGVLTTLVNIITFYVLDLLGVNVYINNTIAWILSVLFAYLTNRKYVFNSDKGNKGFIKEMGFFFLFRIFSYGIDMFTMFVMVDILNIGKLLSKVVDNVIVIIINYFTSKLFVFKK
ncbi:MAG: GtrA family protein [Bacilli bacterium]|nr:GtrA family protein [Bacilli bacterium]